MLTLLAAAGVVLLASNGVAALSHTRFLVAATRTAVPLVGDLFSIPE